MTTFETVPELVDYLRSSGSVLWAPAVNAPSDQAIHSMRGAAGEILLATSRQLRPDRLGNGHDGTEPDHSDPLQVSAQLYAELCRQIDDDKSAVRRQSSRPIERAFVFVDVSDFSKMGSGVQLLVVLALIRLAKEVQHAIRPAEAQLCIGDGYIYVFENAAAATFFASCLAFSIEHAVAESVVPDFHFRIGVHAGPVRCFWDPGRNAWNYVGDGINGAQRVLGAIGKETDDVVYVSAQVRQHLLRSRWSDQVIATLDNKGRKADKHGNAWRVYQVNHASFFAENYTEEPDDSAPRQKNGANG